jgi:hypothetical protein
MSRTTLGVKDIRKRGGRKEDRSRQERQEKNISKKSRLKAQ